MQPSSSFSEPNVKGTVVKPQGVEEDNVSLKWKVLYLVKKENNVSDDTDLLRFNNSGSNLRAMKICCTGHAEFRSRSVGRHRIWLFDSASSTLG
ncbi:hypothetical protein YC2023_025062 [Brassica napus]